MRGNFDNEIKNAIVGSKASTTAGKQPFAGKGGKKPFPSKSKAAPKAGAAEDRLDGGSDEAEEMDGGSFKGSNKQKMGLKKAGGFGRVAPQFGNTNRRSGM